MATQARIPDTGKGRVVIVGGGFAGIELAKVLCPAAIQVVLIDKHNFHTFQPLLYQVATSGLEADSIIYPFRKIFEDQKNFYFRLAEVQAVDTTARMVETSIGMVRYDYLVIATGASTNFFGNDQMQANAIAIKSVEDAVMLRNTVLNNFEKALQLDDEEQINSLMDYVIVGGGPTGVEVAGALSELRRHVFPCDYKELNFKQMDIHLIQSGPALLKGMSDEAGKKAQEYLEKFGVDVMLNRRVVSYDGYTVSLNTGEKLISRTLIWAAGVTGAPIAGIRPESLQKDGRLLVDRYNKVLGYDNIFALGDVAAMVTEANPYGHPMMAQPAIQQGKLLGKNILNILSGKAPEAFEYRDKGSMATIGRNHAVADIRFRNKDYKTQGFFAWLIWMFIHLMSIVGYRNRLFVLVHWVWSYFSFDKGIRFILGNKKENIPVEATLDHKSVT